MSAQALVEFDIIVVGAGLSGLVAADHCLASGSRVCVLEARDRVGGRTLVAPSPYPPFDLGAAWIWPSINASAVSMAEKLGLEIYESLPDSTQMRTLHEPLSGPIWESITRADHGFGHRILGGMSAFSRKLVQRIGSDAIRLNNRVKSLSLGSSSVLVVTTTMTLRASAVLICVPPRIVEATITFAPPLRAGIVKALRATPTWMGQQGKVVILYEQNWWIAAGFSGQAYSECGPLEWIVDGSIPGMNPYALIGFMTHDPSFRQASRDQKCRRVVEQLVRLFGHQAALEDHHVESSIIFHDWRDVDSTCSELDIHESNPWNHPNYTQFNSALQKPLWNGRLRFAASETDYQNPGFVDGAIHSGEVRAMQVTSFVETLK